LFEKGAEHPGLKNSGRTSPSGRKAGRCACRNQVRERPAGPRGYRL